MAEILISLTIIGIIAAITLPSLIGNINEKTFNAKRKALHARMTQAIALMPSLNGYGVGATEEETKTNAAQAFITNGLSKVLKISNICDNENLKKCGFPNKFTKMGNGAPKMDSPKKLTELNGYFNYTNYSQIDTNSVAFETANGESILTFYNPNCSYTYNNDNFMQPTMCANFIYDLNGRKGPNKVGKDIGFITVFYPTDSEVVAPMPIKYLAVYKNSEHSQFSISYGNAECRKNFGEDARMANIEELKSVFTNNNLGYYSSNVNKFLLSDGYFSATPASAVTVYTIAGYSGMVATYSSSAYTSGTGENSYSNAFCVKR